MLFLMLSIYGLQLVKTAELDGLKLDSFVSQLSACSKRIPHLVAAFQEPAA